jgi:hypothetical protein
MMGASGGNQDWSISNAVAGNHPIKPPGFLTVHGSEIGANILIDGTYIEADTHHGRPLYFKYGSFKNLEATIYYWDQRDGQSCEGWWVAPEVAGSPCQLSTPKVRP